MPSVVLRPGTHQENVRALMAAVGVAPEVAAKRLGSGVVVTASAVDIGAQAIAAELIPILSRTLLVATRAGNANFPIIAEVCVGCAMPTTFAPTIFVHATNDEVLISCTRLSESHCAHLHPLKSLIGACYVASATVFCAVGQGIPNPPSLPMSITFEDIVPADIDLSVPHVIGEAYLAGAGAIGNGLLWAARHVTLLGDLHVVDDDFVSEGNLQRQIWFDEIDLDEPKAATLVAKAQKHMPTLRLHAHHCRLQDHPNRSDGAWLRRLIVGVDSRAGRRHLQNELPGEVFDASTTGSKEIVLHHNRQPNDFACLGCVYQRDEREVSHEEVIAQHLGVDVGRVRSGRIDKIAAHMIRERHPKLVASELEGVAFDTLFKELCSSCELMSDAGKQVIAPFAFVSVLAGTALLLEILRRANGRVEMSNEWRLNPWNPPVKQSRYLRPRLAGCECCGRQEVRLVCADLWSQQNRIWAPTLRRSG